MTIGIGGSCVCALSAPLNISLPATSLTKNSKTDSASISLGRVFISRFVIGCLPVDRTIESVYCWSTLNAGA
jgi:hypothetical protein